MELFEAQHPRQKAVTSEINSTVHHGLVVKGLRHVIVEAGERTRHEYSVPRSVHVNVQEPERVRSQSVAINDGNQDGFDVVPARRRASARRASCSARARSPWSMFEWNHASDMSASGTPQSGSTEHAPFEANQSKTTSVVLFACTETMRCWFDAPNV